jgi:DNA-binding winged helix-turn-helix (wHTH) protein/Tol biopolymer transport system component
MAEAERSLGSVRFGPFELLLDTQELRKHGIPLKLSGQAIQVLSMLATNPGKLVTREELQQKLWPGAPYGDPNHGLNAAINKLRETLGDSATTPVYIETLPGRGYRFIAALGPAIVPFPGTPDVKPPAMSKRWKWVAAATLLAIAAGFVTWWRTPLAVPVVVAASQLTDDGTRKIGTLVADSSRIYYNEVASGTLKIAQVAVTGGVAGAVPTSLESPLIRAIAPGGSALLVLNETTHQGALALWSIPLPAGNPRRLGTIQAEDADFLPDGRFVFSQGSEMYVADGDGTNVKRQLTVPGEIDCLNVSPDRKRVVLEAGDKNGSFLVEAEIDRPRLHEIVRAARNADVSCASWTRDMKFVLFNTNLGHPGRWDIWAFPIQRWFSHRHTGPLQITNGPLSYTVPVPSLDGKSIYTLGKFRRAELVRYDARSKQFKPFLSGVSATDATFSRDGKWTAYISYPDHALWRSRTDGTDQLQLTYPPVQIWRASISPDGRLVAFTSLGSTYLISMDGGSTRKIADDTSVAVSWSPDGDAVLYTGPCGAKNSETKDIGCLEIFNLQSEQRTSIPWVQGVLNATWLTKNTLIASNADSTKLLVFDMKRGTWEELITGSFVSWAPSPDREYVYYVSKGAELKAMRIHLPERKIEQIASLQDLNRLIDWLDPSMRISVAPDGSPIFTRDIGTQELYALTVKWP